MHIAFLTSEYPPMISGGIGTSICSLGRALVKQGNQVTVLGWGEKMDFIDQGVKVRFLQATRIPKMGWLFNRILTARELNRMVRKEGLDIVEAPDWTGLSAGMRLDCPLVIRCHGSDTYFGKLQNYKPRWSVHLAEKMGLQGADGIVSVSKFTADVTQEIFNIDMPIEIIPNGINPNLYSTDFEKGEEGLVLYFGTLVRKKGVLDLAKIFSFVVNENPKAKLLLIGRDTIDKITGRSTWELMQKEMSEEALCRMKYIGAQPHDKMKQWISKAVVCVFPSYAEALPVSWLEAMACAKPVIASNIGWGPEIIENGVNGLLIHPTQHTLYSNAILQLLGNHEERSRLGIAARKKVERSFDIMMTARQSAEWYQGVIDELADRNHR